MKKLITLFSFLICISVFAQDKIYVHTATPENSSAQITYINHPDLNGNPAAGIVFVHNWNPNGGSSTYNDNITGLYYEPAEEKWAIFNEELSNIVEGSHYNVYIGDPSNFIDHIATAANQGSFGNYTTVIDDSAMNASNPGPYAVMCNYWTPNGIYNPSNYGFYYDAGLDKRGIYAENGSTPIPDGAAFKILKTGSGVTRFSHTATAANTSSNYTMIDNAALNGNPNATFIFQHYWGVNGGSSEVDLDATLSVWYDGTQWGIFSEDTSIDMPVDIVFDIIVADQEVLGIGDLEISELSLFPNPATNKLTIQSSIPMSTVEVYNLLGTKIERLELDSNTIELNTSQYATGIYVAKISAGSNTQALKFIKQ